MVRVTAWRRAFARLLEKRRRRKISTSSALSFLSSSIRSIPLSSSLPSFPSLLAYIAYAAIVSSNTVLRLFARTCILRYQAAMIAFSSNAADLSRKVPTTIAIFRASVCIIFTGILYSRSSFTARFLRSLLTALSLSCSLSTSLYFTAALYYTSAGVLAGALARFLAGLI